MPGVILCPICQSDLTYLSEDLMTCSQCFHEWDPAAAPEETGDTALKVLDSNCNELQIGDSVIVIKDLVSTGGFERKTGAT